VLYEFRLYTLGTQLVLWAMIGLVFASMVQRLFSEAGRRESISQGAGA
jgi:predicted cobalt transporter CbtA